MQTCDSNWSMTKSHTKNKDIRNLYRAVPFQVKVQTLTMWERETKKLVDEAHAAFWSKRNTKAPWVSAETMGAFDLPKEEAI